MIEKERLREKANGSQFYCRRRHFSCTLRYVVRVEWLFSDSRQRKKIRIQLGQWRRPENSCNVDSLTCGSILFNHFVYNLFGGRRILLSGVLLCVVENFWCHRLTEWMSERILYAIFPRCLLSLSAQVCKLQVVFAHTHTSSMEIIYCFPIEQDAW